jgi:hypothetical protein
VKDHIYSEIKWKCLGRFNKFYLKEIVLILCLVAIVLANTVVLKKLKTPSDGNSYLIASIEDTDLDVAESADPKRKGTNSP